MSIKFFSLETSKQKKKLKSTYKIVVVVFFFKRGIDQYQVTFLQTLSNSK